MNELFLRIVKRDPQRTEAEIQADIRQFILDAPFELEDEDVEVVNLESPAGNRRRIDVEVGCTVVEVKRDLRKAKVKAEAIDQLSGYVEHRTNSTGLRYVGVLTDGTQWICYNLQDGQLKELTELTLGENVEEIARLVVWLEGILATTRNVAPSAENIEARLGSASSAYILDRATLAQLYSDHKNNKSVQMKRLLWSRLLTSALGTQFEDTDSLFIEHTLLVNTAEIIAHAILRLPIESIHPYTLLNGEKFDESGIYGVVEADFFDWVIEVDGGETFIRTLARRLARFAWEAVEQDVLKILYESVINTETRKQLGEYYTPDWLASAVVDETISDPLNMRVLDPACGSGTFIFHAIRKYIRAAEAKGIAVGPMIDGITHNIVGMDLHPVAVTLARVTYLLAIGRDKLVNSDRGNIQIPVYLGDTLQWQEQNLDLWTSGNLVIKVDDKMELIESELRFPDGLLNDAARFDQLINEMASRASKRKPKSNVPSLKSVYHQLSIPENYRVTVDATFKTMCRLHDEGRDHIWGYYVRNLARPFWLARGKNRVDCLVGNPPWLAYRHMTPQMQTTFRSMSSKRGLWAGAELASHHDLSALFVARSCELYLKESGKFGFVMPNTVLDRSHYAGFRKAIYGDTSIGVKINFGTPWDLRRIRPHFFPRASAVVFGERSAGKAHVMGDDAIIWNGKLATSNAAWESVSPILTRSPGKIRRKTQLSQSPYAPSFTQGATLVPRLAFVVEQQEESPLGWPKGKVGIQSSRNAQEKAPWNKLPTLRAVVESEFVRPFYNGEDIYPFRVGEPSNAIIPCNSKKLFTRSEIEMYAGLQQWWEAAENVWETNRSSERMSLTERLNYQNTLTKQLPTPLLRVVYNRAGMHVVAAKIKNRRAIIANGLYWSTVASEAEADYLCAILNSPTITELARPYMSYGKDERDIHKHVWEIPIPKYDENNEIHVKISQIGGEIEDEVRNIEINMHIHFSAIRRSVRRHIMDLPQGQELNEIVFEMLG